jgi:hypothetical protein
MLDVNSSTLLGHMYVMSLKRLGPLRPITGASAQYSNASMEI